MLTHCLRCKDWFQDAKPVCPMCGDALVDARQAQTPFNWREKTREQLLQGRNRHRREVRRAVSYHDAGQGGTPSPRRGGTAVSGAVSEPSQHVPHVEGIG